MSLCVCRAAFLHSFVGQLISMSRARSGLLLLVVCVACIHNGNFDQRGGADCRSIPAERWISRLHTRATSSYIEARWIMTIDRRTPAMKENDARARMCCAQLLHACTHRLLVFAAALDHLTSTGQHATERRPQHAGACSTARQTAVSTPAGVVSRLHSRLTTTVHQRRSQLPTDWCICVVMPLVISMCLLTSQSSSALCYFSRPHSRIVHAPDTSRRNELAMASSEHHRTADHALSVEHER
jgi:hypothetical protein